MRINWINVKKGLGSDKQRSDSSNCAGSAAVSSGTSTSELDSSSSSSNWDSNSERMASKLNSSSSEFSGCDGPDGSRIPMGLPSSSNSVKSNIEGASSLVGVAAGDSFLGAAPLVVGVLVPSPITSLSVPTGWAWNPLIRGATAS